MRVRLALGFVACSAALVAAACGSTDTNGTHSESSAGKAGAVAKNSGGSSGSGGSNPVDRGGTNSGAGSSNHGGTSAGGSTAQGGSAGTPGKPTPKCDTAEEKSGNWTECSNGLYHRPSPASCKSNLPRARVLESTSPDDDCRQDSDCKAHPHGYCERSFYPPFDYKNRCVYGCTSDSECDANELCVCAAIHPFIGEGDIDTNIAATVGTCRPSDGCRSDADCEQGFWCTNYVASCAGTGMNFACQTAQDECASNFDCPESGTFCGYEQGARVCKRKTCEH